MLISILVLFLWSSFVYAMEERICPLPKKSEMKKYLDKAPVFSAQQYVFSEKLDDIVSTAKIMDILQSNRIEDLVTFKTVDEQSITALKKVCYQSKFLEAFINFSQEQGDTQSRKQDDIQLKELDYATMHNVLYLCALTMQKEHIQKRMLERLSLEESAQIWAYSDYFGIDKKPFVPQYTRYLMSEDGVKDIKNGELKLLGDTTLQDSVELCSEELKRYPPGLLCYVKGRAKSFFVNKYLYSCSNFEEPVGNILINNAQSAKLTFNREHSHLRMWDLKTNKLLYLVKQRNHTLLGVCMGCDDALIITLSNHNGQSHITLFDAQTGEKINTVALQKIQNETVRGISYHPGGIVIHRINDLSNQYYAFNFLESINENYSNFLQKASGKVCFLHHLLEQKAKQKNKNKVLDQYINEIFQKCNSDEIGLIHSLWAPVWLCQPNELLDRIEYDIQEFKNNSVANLMEGAGSVLKKTFMKDLGGAVITPVIGIMAAKFTMNFLKSQGYSDNVIDTVGASGAIGSSLLHFLWLDKKTAWKAGAYFWVFFELTTKPDVGFKRGMYPLAAIDLGATLLKNSWIAYDKYSFKRAPGLLKTALKYAKISTFFTYAAISRPDLITNHPYISSALGLVFMRKWMKQHYQIPSIGFYKKTDKFGFMWSGKKLTSNGKKSSC